MKKSWVVVLMMLALYSCNKGTKYSNIPKISFLSLSDTVLKAATAKKVLISFDFEDGDGNIGFGSKNLFLIDSRHMTDTERHEIPEIPEKFDPKNGLKGIIQLETNGAFLTLRGTPPHEKTDTLFWYLFMKDEAGNMSNIIQTPNVVLKDSL